MTTQLNQAILTLQDEHATFIEKGTSTHQRTTQMRGEVRAVADAALAEKTQAEGHRDTVLARQGETQAAREAAETAMVQTGATYREAHAARRQVAEAVREANIAKHKVDSLASGDMDRYGHWLLNTPVANGTLKLDFAQQSFKVWDTGQVRTKDFTEVMSFTRASTKWVWNAEGVLTEVPVDQPAYDHDPVTGEPLGVLIEPGATNLLPWSEDFLNWGKTGATSVIYDGEITAPNQTLGAYKVFDSGSTGTPLINRVLQDVPENTTLTLSVFAKEVEGAQLRLSIRSKAGPYLPGHTVSISEGVPVGGGWYRHDHTANVGEGTGDVQALIYPTAGSNEANALCIWGAQLETGPVATSYIPTAGAAVTRAADRMYRDLGAEYSAGGYTVLATLTSLRSEQDTDGSIGNRITWRDEVINVGNGSNRDVHRLTLMKVRSSNAFGLGYYPGSGTGGHLTLPGGSWPDNEKVRVGFSAESQTNRISVAANGFANSTVRAATTEILSNTNRLHIGRTYRRGFLIQDVQMYPYAMTAEELQQFSTPIV